ncbi:Thioredox-DsbH domain-containing protein [Fusarium keratoplasticum]|uniref:Thioredox-DsbH domain-containing protein n=1 Tax=Fusarium keratoplasticum TaxID=1328300 RepID=A0ACC0R9N9_9HYPO|nr:Thioredox-DsbH domain-containing protein [Fusarium keratoplasticum]KAI8680014.1 Thioredox-DsbH domain-containing protein [Fusarium keratoplasticum]KAI8686095.1 Thioredox-DsbH domain-containing protein [Fusarium keratoplasticum]
MVASQLTASAKAMRTTPVAGAAAGLSEPLPALQNRAASSRSPYIKDQVSSLVAWQLLDDETVERARKENKLIFLHIGYKACHFCRLMLLESFSNPDCASVLNESFVPVIVDREERPDLDTIYMNYVQAVSNAGGWPLNLFLTPNLEPVFGGTYWPGPAGRRHTTDDSADEVLDFLTIVKKVRDIWSDQESRCRKEATEVLGQLREFAAEGTLGTRNISAASALAPSGWGAPAPSHTSAPKDKDTSVSEELDLDQLEEAYTHIAGTFDPVYGGFGLAPKFLTPPKLAFLLGLLNFPREVQDVVGEAECKHATEMALDTLRHIRDGALHDHVGGTGFSRCSVTPDWSIPNFEKLVVDNAQLLSLYLDAWKSTGGDKPTEFFDIVIELAEYLSSAPIALSEGGFASSEAADSHYRRGDREMREGAYYVWTRREFDSVLDEVNKHMSPVLAAHWAVNEDGNVDEHHDPNDDFINQNILRIDRSVQQLSVQFSIPEDKVRQYVQEGKVALKQRRDKERVRPDLDDKVVAGWNGLVISALAKTALALKNLRPEQSAKYLAVAEKAAKFIQEKLWDSDRKVLYRIWSGERETQAFADDYAYLTQGLLDLFDATGNEAYLVFADTLQQTQLSLFYDPEGAFFSTQASSPHTILRLKDGMDTSVPSTNAISVSNLFRIADLLSDDKLAVNARQTINAFEAEMLQHPWLFPGLLAGVVTARLGSQRRNVNVNYKPERLSA